MIFTVSDGGVAMCRDAASGKRLWQQRIGGNFSASPVVVGDRLYLFGREGKTTVIAVADEYRELAENELDDAIGASPAVVDGELILRTEDALYRIAERAASRKR
jgi:outer membrane protein assembly factor BamB